MCLVVKGGHGGGHPDVLISSKLKVNPNSAVKRSAYRSRSTSSILEVLPVALRHFLSATGKDAKDETKNIIQGASYSIYMLLVLAKLKEIEFAAEEKGIAADIRTVLTSNFHDFKNHVSAF